VVPVCFSPVSRHASQVAKLTEALHCKRTGLIPYLYPLKAMPLPDRFPPVSKMESWVITGGVACGKSAVMERVAALLGAKVRLFSCDEAVHHLYDNPAVVLQIVTRFGSEVLSDGGGNGIDRQRLGAKVFGDPVGRQQLEGVLHPLVLAALEQERLAAAQAGTVNLFVAEVPLYHEIGGTVAADRVIVVASSPDQQVRRLMQNRGLDQARSEAMVASQWPILDKAAEASQVIWNDGGPEALEDQIAALVSLFDRT
jgi:dephospho-CoA kinase